ncbi:MAG: phenylalanine--tRNA ligase subunit beta, partial [Myxococcales bacterium]
MKASFGWLRALVPALPDDPEEVAARLTAAGLEVEGTSVFGEACRDCVVARVDAVRPHPSRASLQLVLVDRGGALQEVVCGAPNVPSPGGLVVLAPIGTHLPAKGITLDRRVIGGIASEGMLCSEEELGLADKSDGILVLAPGLAAPGTLFSQAEPGSYDTLFEIGLTPNRPDGLGHLGLARELSALFRVPFAPSAPVAPSAKGPTRFGDLVDIAIDDADRCSQYGAAILVDTTVAPSPPWLRYRLLSLGVRPVSNLVDITNLVMLEYGHPMHAFDLDCVRGGLIGVRRATVGEQLRTLDGVVRTLSEDDLVITDGGGPVALAGVMGGGESEIASSTRRVLLECATFDPRSIRRSSRRHGLHTESSHRFERGVDQGDTELALARAASLVAQLAGGAAVPARADGGAVRLFVTKAVSSARVVLRPSRLEQLLGVKVARDEATAILERLGFRKVESDAYADTFEVPTHRPDVSREVDLIEEVARVWGFHHIPATLAAIRPSGNEGRREDLGRRTRAIAVGLGLSETLLYGFVSPESLARVGAPTAAVVLKNPLNERSVMRTSLLPGLLDAVGGARRRGERDVRFFSVGARFLKAGGRLPEERLSFAAVMAGDRAAYLAKPEAVDVWDAKGLALGVLERLLGQDVVVHRRVGVDRPAWLHPRGAAEIEVGGTLLGHFGPVHPDTCEAFELGGDVQAVELDLARVEALGRPTRRYVAVPRFPASARDLALVVRDDVTAGDVERVVCEAAGPLAEAVGLFDRFIGGAVPAGHV